jgi:hypothetical protein
MEDAKAAATKRNVGTADDGENDIKYPEKNH